MGSFRDLDAGVAPTKVDPKGGTFRNMDLAGRKPPAKKATAKQEAAGVLSTLTRIVPGLDEYNDGVFALGKTVADNLTGKDSTLGSNWTEARGRSRSASTDFGARHPVLKPLTEGVGIAAQAVPAFFTGGATLAPGLITAATKAAAPAARAGLLGAVARAVPQVVRTGARIGAKGAVTGGLSGAVSELASDGTLGERTDAMTDAIPLSMALGGVLPLAFAGAGGVANLSRRLLAPSDEKAAAQAGRVLASQAPEAMTLGPPANDGITLPFERMGPGGETVARAVASVPGPGQTMAREALTERGQGARGRMMASVARELGDDGAGFHPSREALDVRRLADSKPLYAEAFDREPPISNDLTRLSARPSIRQAMERGAKLAREEGEDPRALGLFHMEDPADWVSEAAPFGVSEDARRVAGFGRNPRKPTQGPSLSKFVADNGGISDSGGDVAGMGGSGWHRGKAYQGKLIGDGGDADEWALRAWEQGYFPNHRERPTVNEFLDALDGDVSGRRKVFGREIDPRAADRFQRAEEADEMMYRGGSSDDLPEESDYTGRPEPRQEPVFGEAPTFKAWDYVKRGLDDLIESRRDPVTGKLERSDEVRGWDKTRQELRRHLRTINPKYGEALDAYSGPSHQMHALDLGRKMVDGRMDAEDLEAGLGRMSADELDSLRLGIARGLSDKFRRSDPQKAFREFMNNELIQDRLRIGFGNDQAYGRFMNDIGNEFEAQLSRNRILTGSRTTPLAEDIAAVNHAADDGGLLSLGLTAAKDGRPFRQQAFGWAVEKLRQAKQTGTGLNNEEVSRLLGQALFRAGDPEALLRAMVGQRVISTSDLETILPYLAAGGGQISATGTSATR